MTSHKLTTLFQTSEHQSGNVRDIFSHSQSFIGMCNRCWVDNVYVALNNSCEILCDKCNGEKYR